MEYSFNLKHLYYFWIIAREGSVARASEVLNLAPQTLSGQMATLEEAVGTRLLERRGRRLQLTEAGEGAMRYADRMFQAATELDAFLGRTTEVRSVRLAVGISASIHKLFAYQFIEPALQIDTPQTLKCRTGSPQDLIRALRSQELDVVLTDRIPATEEGFRWHLHTLESSSISLFAAPALAHKVRPGFPASLHQVPFLTNSLEAPYHQQLLQWLYEQGIVPHQAGEIDDSALIKVFGRAGLGVFAAPSVIAEEVCRQYEVETIAQVEEISDQVYAITRPSGRIHPGVAAICHASGTSFLDSGDSRA